jgi:hypothetical protein
VLNEELVVAEQVVPTDHAGSMKIRISQHAVEDFWRVDVCREPDGHGSCTTTTVGTGDSFMMNLIQGAVGGEELAWRHLAHWGQDALARASRPGQCYALGA